MPHLPHFSPHLSRPNPLIIYALIFFLVSTGDAVMSYLSPIFIESHTHNPFWMGVIISFSSVVGLICDLLFPKVFPHKKFTFYFWLTLLTALLFPFIFLSLPPALLVFLVGMAVWGIYYELIGFSTFNFIASHIARPSYTSAWGLLDCFKGAAYLIGPLLASFAISFGFDRSFLLVCLIYLAAIFGFTVFTKSLPASSLSDTPSHSYPVFRSWKILLSKIWPLYLFYASISLVDSAFWTVGTILSENLKLQHPMGQYLLPAYTLPSLFMGLLASRLAQPLGKKRTAFICGLLAGLILGFLGFSTSVPALILLVFLSSLLTAIAIPEISATFEDYMSRLPSNLGTSLIGLQSSATSLAYIIGPIISGALAAVMGYQNTLVAMGLIMAVIALIALLAVPRKIHLPQSQLAQIPA